MPKLKTEADVKTAFEDAFCGGVGLLSYVSVDKVTKVKPGWAIDLDLRDSSRTQGDVRRQAVHIAKLFGIRSDNVDVTYVMTPKKDNEGYCRVLVTT